MQKHYDKIAIFKQYMLLQEFRKTIILTPFLTAILQFQQDSIASQYYKSDKKHNNNLKKTIAQYQDRFVEAFSSQNIQEKLDMYIRQMKYINHQICHIDVQKIIPSQFVTNDAYTLSYNLHIWKKKCFELNCNSFQLLISRDKITKVYDLRNYIIRQSKNNQYDCFVLQATNTQVGEKNRVVRVGFKTNDLFKKCFIATKTLIIKAERQKITKQLSKIQKGSYLKLQQKIQSSGSNNGKLKQLQTISKTPQNQQTNQQKKQYKNLTVEENKKQECSMKMSPKSTLQNNTYGNIFETILPSYQLTRLIQKDFHEVIYQDCRGLILRNNNNPQRYKLFIQLQQEQTNLEEASKVLVDINKYTKWNTSVEECKIQSTISSQNLVIVYQKNKSFNAIYRQRDFVYLKHVFSRDGNFYMVDKSIDHSEYPPYTLIVRGNIQCIWGIIKNTNNPRRFTIAVDIMIENQGIINTTQDHNISMLYLKGLLDFKNQIQRRQGQLSQNTSVFDLQWADSNDFSSNWDEQESIQKQQVQITSLNKNPKEPAQQQMNNKDKKRRATVQTHIPLIKQQKKRRVTVQERYQPEQKNNKNQQTQNILKSSDQNVKINLINLTNNQNHNNHQSNQNNRLENQHNYLKVKSVLSPITSKQVLFQEVINGHPIWKGQWVNSKQGGMIFTNQAKIGYQKKIFKHIIGKMAENLLTGKSIVNVSLPVKIFAPETNLERFAFSMTYAPIFLEKGFKFKSPLQKFKWVVAYGLTNSILYLNMEKPFNPILGQTFQGWINGCPIYLEQISHHPPIAAFLLLGRGYKISGSLQSKIELNMNSGCGITDGIFKIIADDGADFNFITPGGQISGLIFGERKFNLVGKYFVWSKRYQFFLQIKLDSTNTSLFAKRQQPSDYMEGYIYEVTRDFIQDFQLMKNKEGPPKQKIIHSRGKVSGIWSKIMLIEGQTYLDLDKDIGYKLEYQQNALPSNGRWRKDVIYKSLNDDVNSQTEKQKLQSIQRNDQKLRQMYKKKKY